jgi:cytochrome c-type biogenesis protein CcmF
LYNQEFSKIAAVNPSTRRYLGKDIFTHITSLPESEMDAEARKAIEDNLNYRDFNVPAGQTYTFYDTVDVKDQQTQQVRQYQLFVEGVEQNATHPDYTPEEGDMALGARIQIRQMGDDTVYTAKPVIVLRDQLLYNYPVQINDLSTKVKLNESILENMFIAEESLSYEEFKLKQGETTTFGDLSIRFLNFNRQPKHANYQPEEQDIAVGGNVEIRTADGKQFFSQPVYLIRGNRPYNVKDQVPELGLHVRFASIDPATESISLMIARHNTDNNAIPLAVATNSVRSDFLVLQAIVFPGINLVWLGSLLMLGGMAVSLWHRRRSRSEAA